jgi:hypothetical protein
MPRISRTIVAVLAIVQLAVGHTWIEQLRNVNDKGQYVGEYGYPRGMFSKTDPGYDGTKMNFEIPAYQGGKIFIQNDTLLCHPNQRQQKQSGAKYPRLQAVPGGFIAMRYMENGHVTKPENQKGKPEHGGTVFVYGTTQPKANEKIADVLHWTQDGKGGDGRGLLLATNNYDDGRCYENNDTPVHLQRAKEFPNYAMGQGDTGPGTMPLFCETNVQIPKTTATGKPYTIYWVWQWPTASGGIDPSYKNGKDEYYSTCIDVDVASAKTALATDAEPKFALGQQDAMAQAVADFKSRTAAMTDALKGEVGPIFGGGKQTPAPSAPAGGAPSRAPAPSQAPVAPSQAPAPALSAQPSQASGPAGIPTLTQRPGAAPSSPPDGGNVVTVTDTVLVTMTAQVPSQATPSMVTSKRAISSAKSKAPPAAGITPSPVKPGSPVFATSDPAAPSKLPGFNMSRPHGAKFRMLRN